MGEGNRVAGNNGPMPKSCLLLFPDTKNLIVCQVKAYLARQLLGMLAFQLAPLPHS